MDKINNSLISKSNNKMQNAVTSGKLLKVKKLAKTRARVRTELLMDMRQKPNPGLPVSQIVMSRMVKK